jgi:LPXTG-motif cell wall-anchored protein
MVLLAVALVLAPVHAPPAAADSVIGTITVGVGPYGVAVSPGGTKVYITNVDDDTISVFTIATSVVTTISAGAGPFDVAFSPDGVKAFVTNFTGNTVSVIDVATDTITATIPVSATPYRVAISPDGTKAYVSHFTAGGTVDVIDVATDFVTSTISVGDWLGDVAFSPGGQVAYVAGAGGLYVIDVTAGSLVGAVALPDITGMVFSPDGTVAYLSDIAGTSLLVFDVVSQTVTNTIPVGSAPRGVDVSPDGTKVYVANTGASTVSVVDTGTGSVIATVTVGLNPIGVAFSPSGTTAFTTNSGGNTVSVIAVDQLAVLVPQTPVPPATVGSSYSFATAVSLGTPAAVFSISAGALPAGLAIDPVSGVISGVPTVAGVFAFTVTATNGAGDASDDYGITVAAALAATGVSVEPLLVIAGLLLLAGALALVLRRRAAS